MSADSIKTSCGILELVQGDITRQQIEAIANAANEGLRGGGGVDGAIHRAGGPSIMQECREIGCCPTGSAVITTAGALPAKYVIHTVGPVWRGGTNNEATLLSSCYRTSIKIAKKHSVKSIAFPSISTGVYGYPVAPAAEIALQTCLATLQPDYGIELLRFVLFDSRTYDAYSRALELLK